MGRVVKGFFFPSTRRPPLLLWRRNIFPVYTPLLSPATLDFPARPSPDSSPVPRLILCRSQNADRPGPTAAVATLACEKMSDAVTASVRHFGQRTDFNCELPLTHASPVCAFNACIQFQDVPS